MADAEDEDWRLIGWDSFTREFRPVSTTSTRCSDHLWWTSVEEEEIQTSGR